MAAVEDVRKLLSTTSMPDHVIDSLLSEASVAWLLSDRATVVAGDLALCHPPLGDGEVRAVVRPTSRPRSWRLTVVSPDHPGLLAALAGTLAAAGLSVHRVAAMCWTGGDQAIISLGVSDPGGAHPDWDQLGPQLRTAAISGTAPAVAFRPQPPVQVDVSPQGAGRAMVTVTAPDRVGMLWAITDWLAQRGVNIDAVQVRPGPDPRVGQFVVAGEVDATALAAHLSGQTPANLLQVIGDVARLPIRVALRLLGRS